MKVAGWRKFAAFLIVFGASCVFLAYGKMSDAIFRDITWGALGLFTAGNVVSKFSREK